MGGLPHPWESVPALTFPNQPTVEGVEIAISFLMIRYPTRVASSSRSDWIANSITRVRVLHRML